MVASSLEELTNRVAQLERKLDRNLNTFKAVRWEVQAIPNGVWTPVELSTTVLGGYPVVQSKIHMTSGGKYMFIGMARFRGQALGGSRYVAVFRNGVTWPGIGRIPKGEDLYDQFPLIVAAEQLDAGDYVELRVYQDSGSPLDIMSVSAYPAASLSIIGLW